MLTTRLCVALLCVCSSVTFNGCAGTYAKEGAAQGAVGGAVAGAVGSLFFGGNVLENAAVGAITGAQRAPPLVG